MEKLTYWKWYWKYVQNDTKFLVPVMLLLIVGVLILSFNGMGEAWLGICFSSLCLIWWLRMVIMELIIDRIKYLKNQ